MLKIKKILGRQIIDSRGNPTCEADIVLDDGTLGRGAVPSGASTGKLEALELRDNDPNTYLGKSVNNAIDNINNVISSKINSDIEYDQASFDNFLIDFDGTHNKERLGANAILALSIAFANAKANKLKIPLYQSLTEESSYTLPIPMMNIINGGAHANNKLDFQEFMILPIGFDKITESIRAGAEIFHTLKDALNKLNMPTSVGDEGGFAPNLNSNSEAIAPVTISSGSTAVDELVESTANGAVYYLVSKNATEGAYAVNEVILAMGGADITVASSAFVSTKETNQLTFDADFKTDAENTGRLLCASTSGANTTVSAYRINLLAK